MATPHTVADLPRLEVRGPKSAVVTVTERDGERVTVSTWTTCVGVGAFVRDLLGQPGQQVTVNAREGS